MLLYVIDQHISKMLLSHWEPLGVSESCWTRITGWPNPRVYWTDAVAFRCTWEHLGAPVTRLGTPTTSLDAPATSLGSPRITVEQSGRNNIFFGNTAGAPGNHSYYLSFNDFYNSCIQFVFSSMYLCIYIATHLDKGYLDWLQVVLDSESRCA
jgi:hypothetical protein